MHWKLFIRQISLLLYVFRVSSTHLQEDKVVHKQHMVPSLSIRVLVACWYAAIGSNDIWRINNFQCITLVVLYGRHICYSKLNTARIFTIRLFTCWHSPIYEIVRFLKIRRQSQFSIHMVNYTCIYTRKDTLNPNSNTLEPDWPQHARPTNGVITQQNSSSTFFTLRFHYPKKKYQHAFQKCFISIF